MKNARVAWSVALLVGLAASTVSGSAAAAKEVALGAAYDARVPMGGFRRLIPNTSFGGFQAKWDIYPFDWLATGVQVQYNLFQRDPLTDTLTTEDTAVTGTTFRYASFWSFIPTARYYLFEHSPVRPYAELGAGLLAATSVVLVSDQSERQFSTAFILQPSAGVLWRLTPDRRSRALDADVPAVGAPRKPLDTMFGLTASASYAFTTADVIGASNISHAGIQIGIYAMP